MDFVLQLFTKPTEVQTLNTCRLHLQVTLLSNITMTDGITILTCHQQLVAIIINYITTVSLPIKTIPTRLETMEQTHQQAHASWYTHSQTTFLTMVLHRRTSTLEVDSND